VNLHLCKAEVAPYLYPPDRTTHRDLLSEPGEDAEAVVAVVTSPLGVLAGEEVTFGGGLVSAAALS
jgi:hypothetical protein